MKDLEMNRETRWRNYLTDKELQDAINNLSDSEDGLDLSDNEDETDRDLVLEHSSSDEDEEVTSNEITEKVTKINNENDIQEKVSTNYKGFYKLFFMCTSSYLRQQCHNTKI